MCSLALIFQLPISWISCFKPHCFCQHKNNALIVVFGQFVLKVSNYSSTTILHNGKFNIQIESLGLLWTVSWFHSETINDWLCQLLFLSSSTNLASQKSRSMKSIKVPWYQKPILHNNKYINVQKSAMFAALFSIVSILHKFLSVFPAT